MIEKTTSAVAVGATASPWWLPALADVSQAAGLLLPVAGLVWLLIQIGHWIYKRWD